MKDRQPARPGEPRQLAGLARRQVVLALSANIKEADGTTAQDTNSGAGVKTGHIQNGAITTDKIQDGAVTSAKLSVPMYSKSEVDALVGNLQDQIAYLQDLLQHFSRDGNEITITGANLHVVNGSGYTWGSVNGTGNIIVGYNEQGVLPIDHAGSHNIVVGMGNNYSSFASLAVGSNHQLLGAYSAIVGGFRNTVDRGSAIAGGYFNSAEQVRSFIGGGSHGATVHRDYPHVEGSAILGGSNNVATGWGSSVCGGSGNTAAGDDAVVGGGHQRSAPDTYNWAAGSLLEGQ